MGNIISNFPVYKSTAQFFFTLWRESVELSPIASMPLPKLAFKKSIRKALFAALEGEEDYIEAPTLLSN